MAAISKIIFRILYGKEGDIMVAMLWTNQIILGKKTFAQVPKLLKDQVRELLTDAGMEELIIE